MNRTMLLMALVLLECCLLFAAFSDSHLDKPGAASAWYEWHGHPSAETEAAWLGERRRMRVEQVMIELIIWSMIAAGGFGIVYVARKAKQQS
jgi:hypothetical protein